MGKVVEKVEKKLMLCYNSIKNNVEILLMGEVLKDVQRQQRALLKRFCNSKDLE